MSKYKVNNEGVAALNNSANRVSKACDEISKLLEKLKSAASDNLSGLGPHASELNASIEEISASVDNSSGPAEEICQSLFLLAKKYQELIDNNPFNSFSSALGNARGNSAGNKSEEIDRAVFEIENFKNGLELGNGDESYPQIGGIYGKMDTVSGFERHHIPSNAVQAEKKEKLPAILISKDDHKKTDSFRGKQNSKFSSLLPDTPDFPAYKEVVANEIANGNYVEVVKAEIYNIIDKCGHRYPRSLFGQNT